MVGKYDEVFVLDWGLRMERLNKTKSGGDALGKVRFGTPRYMSPEQASGVVHGLNATTDIYSLARFWLRPLP